MLQSSVYWAIVSVHVMSDATQDLSTAANVICRIDDLFVRLAGYTLERTSARGAKVQAAFEKGRLVYSGHHCSRAGCSQRLAAIS
jgi:hypothetical protein